MRLYNHSRFPPHISFHFVFPKKSHILYEIFVLFSNLIEKIGAKKSPIEQCNAIKLVIDLQFFLRKYPPKEKINR